MHQRVAYCPPPSPNSDPSSSTTQLGTIRYKGPVPPTKGVWYGIEWDDAARGKHSGVYVKTGERFFETKVETAGSFLRPDAKGLETKGKTFKQALYSKYLDVDLLNTTTDSTAPPNVSEGDVDVTRSELYGTNSNFDVEVVLSKKVNDRFKQLGRLREVGLEWVFLNRAADPGSEEELRRLGNELSRLEVLNLSYSLLPTLVEAERIAAVLPRLRQLALNSNRFAPIPEPLLLPGFERLTSLQLNSTLLTWTELRHASPSLVNLFDLQFGFNRLRRLRETPVKDTAEPILPKLERLNLESNELDDWQDIVEELSVLPSLTDLILTSNRLSTLVLPPGAAGTSSPTLPTLRHLSLSGNVLSSWMTSIDALSSSYSSVFPSLTSARLSGNALFESASDVSGSSSVGASQRSSLHARLVTIARWPALLELEGTAITVAEREDAERFWLEQLAMGEEREADLGEWARGRVKELRTKNGVTSLGNGGTSRTSRPTLKDRLLHLHLRLDPSLPSPPPEKSTLSVLPTLRTLLLRTQISRLVSKSLPKDQYRLIAILQGGENGTEVRVEIPPNEEGKEVSWWGLQDGDAVGVEAM